MSHMNEVGKNRSKVDWECDMKAVSYLNADSWSGCMHASQQRVTTTSQYYTYNQLITMAPVNNSGFSTICFMSSLSSLHT